MTEQTTKWWKSNGLQIVRFALYLVTLAVALTIQYATVSSKVETNTASIVRNTEAVRAHEARLAHQEMTSAVQYAEIQKDLKYIQALLEELRESH